MSLYIACELSRELSIIRLCWFLRVLPYLHNLDLDILDGNYVGPEVKTTIPGPKSQVRLT